MPILEKYNFTIPLSHFSVTEREKGRDIPFLMAMAIYNSQMRFSPFHPEFCRNRVLLLSHSLDYMCLNGTCLLASHLCLP